MSANCQHAKQIINLVHKLSGRHGSWEVFRDFVAMAAISVRNAVNVRDREQYETEYLHIAKRYDKDELAVSPQMLGELTLALENDMADILGYIFSNLELGNKWKGQFFTPDCVCRMMAMMTYADKISADLENKKFITLSEPAVGGGAMVIAFAHTMKNQGANYQKQLHVTAVDVDIRAVHMAYLQLSLLHIPAVVIHGNALSLEEYSHWHTPAHILGFWDSKLTSRD